MVRRKTRYRDIVAIGASAGGTRTLGELMAGLPKELPAALLVAQHVSPASPALLAELLARAGPLPASTALDGEPIERGHVYVVPPDHHLLAGDDHLIVTRGPRENGHRPAVDPLFRSAARRYGPRVIAVVLSGTLDDGTAGLIAVKARGGMTIVQDPDDALHRGMPENAIEGDSPDHVVPVSELADLLCTLVQQRLAPTTLNAGSGLSLGAQKSSIHRPDELRLRGATPASVTCPEYVEQAHELETLLWSAVRGLSERAELLRRMASGRPGAASGMATRYLDRARDCEQQAEAIVTAVQRLGRTNDVPDASAVEASQLG